MYVLIQLINPRSLLAVRQESCLISLPPLVLGINGTVSSVTCVLQSILCPSPLPPFSLDFQCGWIVTTSALAVTGTVLSVQP